jgi:hypothetical protein
MKKIFLIVLFFGSCSQNEVLTKINILTNKQQKNDLCLYTKLTVPVGNLEFQSMFFKDSYGAFIEIPKERVLTHSDINGGRYIMIYSTPYKSFESNIFIKSCKYNLNSDESTAGFVELFFSDEKGRLRVFYSDDKIIF